MIAIPTCARGLGDIISSPESPLLLDGVRIETGLPGQEDLGWIQDAFRKRPGCFGPATERTTEVAATVSHTGVIKAFHFQLAQDDLCAPIRGTFQLALADLRPHSPTFGRKNTLYLGEHAPWRVLIPPGVAYGYRVVSPEWGVLVRATESDCQPSALGCLPHDHPGLAYDWSAELH